MAMMKIMSAAEYHAGPCLKPELSSSIVKILDEKTPKHAYYAHPKLGRSTFEDESEEEVSTTAMVLGTAVHKLALGKGQELAVINPANHVGARGGVPKGWTNDSIRTARSEAVAQGKLPILQRHYQIAFNCAKSLRNAVEAYLGIKVTECLTESVILWEEDDVCCKAMIDIIRPDFKAWCDIKSTGICVSAESATRHFYSENYHIQAAMYERALDALNPENAGRRRMAYIFAESKAPFLCSQPIEPSESGLQIGRQAVMKAIKTWSRCLKTTEWPGYSLEPYVGMPPPWLIMESEAKNNGV